MHWSFTSISNEKISHCQQPGAAWGHCRPSTAGQDITVECGHWQQANWGGWLYADESTDIGDAAGEQLLELEYMVGFAQCNCVAFIGIGALHYFLSAAVTYAAGLVLDIS